MPPALRKLHDSLGTYGWGMILTMLGARFFGDNADIVLLLLAGYVVCAVLTIRIYYLAKRAVGKSATHAVVSTSFTGLLLLTPISGLMIGGWAIVFAFRRTLNKEMDAPPSAPSGPRIVEANTKSADPVDTTSSAPAPATPRRRAQRPAKRVIGNKRATGA